MNEEERRVAWRINSSKLYNLPIYYINLDKRSDRCESIENQLKLFNLFHNSTRICAVDRTSETINKRGAGCSLSHSIAFSHAIRNNEEHGIILEDDFVFTVSRSEFEKRVGDLFKYFPHFNVCNFAYNDAYGELQIIPGTEGFYKGKVQASSGYIFKSSYAKDILLPLFLYGAGKLEAGEAYSTWALDQSWKEYQDDPNWVQMTKCGIQKLSYSDIEDTGVNYGV